jgi:tetratricopeptide (TPR) repeat protein
MKNAWKSLGAVCALVVGVYAYTPHEEAVTQMGLSAAGSRYNLLVQGFCAGQLNLKKDVPPGLAQLADPYDPDANRPYLGLPYRLDDLSYYRGKLYFYFGVTPSLVLFWPYVALTGHYLSHRLAVLIFCVVGFLVSVGLLRVMWRRYFTEVSVAVVAINALAIGLATGVPMILSRPDEYEVAISCGYMLTVLALAGVWGALHDTERARQWLAVASVAYGLAIGARPNQLFGAVILLAPVIQAWQQRRRVGPLLMAAIVPITLIGLALMLYNELRFDSPFEFGLRYQLGGAAQITAQQFSPRYLWFNFRVNFFKPAHWSARIPFVHPIAMPPFPAGYFGTNEPFGALTNVPLVWLSLAAPLAWSNRPAHTGRALGWFAVALALLFGTCALLLSFYCYSAFRYEVDFLPALALLAMVGILGLERALADRLAWRRAARCGWGLLLAFSVAFNLCASVENYTVAHYDLGNALAMAGRVPDAIVQYEQALRINPDFANAHNNLGNAFLQEGRVSDAIGHYEQALRIKPDYAKTHNNLGIALVRLGRAPEAIEHYEQALRLDPDYAEAHYNLGVTLGLVGRIPEAIGHLEQALRLKPNYAQAHHDLGVALEETGKIDEAIAHFEQALRIKPDDAEAHFNLAVALENTGRTREALDHYQHALKLRPDFAPASDAVARLQVGQ